MSRSRRSDSAHTPTVGVDEAAVDRAIEAAFARTVRRHRQLGLPLFIRRNGRVVEVSTDDIALREDGQVSALSAPSAR